VIIVVGLPKGKIGMSAVRCLVCASYRAASLLGKKLDWARAIGFGFTIFN